MRPVLASEDQIYAPFPIHNVYLAFSHEIFEPVAFSLYQEGIAVMENAIKDGGATTTSFIWPLEKTSSESG